MVKLLLLMCGLTDVITMAKIQLMTACMVIVCKTKMMHINIVYLKFFCVYLSICLNANLQDLYICFLN